MIDIEPAHLTLIKKILRHHVPAAEVRAFGSRINGTATQFSDLDLVIIAHPPLSWEKIEQIKNAFSESNLPITVDIVNWASISDDFKAIIEHNYTLIQPAKPL
ncbi:MAG: nucleotidyltransferase domain-containing protein [Pseudomonadota bacterium]